MENGLRISAVILSWMLAAAALVVLSGHGGGTAQVVDQPIGGLRATVWTEPEAPRVGEAFHVTVALYQATAADHDTPVTEAQVVVRLIGPEGQEVAREAALDPGPPPTFAADVVLPAPGEWQGEVHVTAAEGQGTVRFAVHVEAASRGAGWWLWAAVGGAVVVALGWWWQQRRAR